MTKSTEHKDIALWLRENHIESGWWSQMVTVGYEQARGLRQKHEKPTGFDVGRSKTFPVPDGRRANEALLGGGVGPSVCTASEMNRDFPRLDSA